MTVAAGSPGKQVPFDSAEEYRGGGWAGILALPPRKKHPPEDGFTGYDKRWSSPDDWMRWRDEGRTNIALRLPPNIIGLDVDAYGDKSGADTLRSLETRWGELPGTWISTSRTDGISGIRFFRLPAGALLGDQQGWPSVAGSGIEIIRCAHRYAVVSPSLHPEGRVYRWQKPEGTWAGEGELPRPGDLPELPQAWVDGLTGGSAAPAGGTAGTRAQQREARKKAQAWLSTLPEGDPCAYVGQLAADVMGAARREDGNAYDHTRDAVMALLRAGETGHPGVQGVLKRARETYVKTVQDRSSANEAAGEFDRFTLDGAVRVMNDPSERAGRGCDCPRRVSPGRAEPRTLEEVISTVRRFFHMPDTGPLVCALGAYAANRVEGAPVWLLLVGPPSGGKTEMLLPLRAMPDVYLCGVLTEASLLSGSPKREHAAGAKGGLLREIGSFGYLLLKDFTSILALNRDSRGQVLGALREIYDGSWVREVGTDGGRHLEWNGKVGLIGGSTPALDSHHVVMASLGERFLLYRLPPVEEDAVAAAALNQALGAEHRQVVEAEVRGLLGTLPERIEPAALDSDERGFLIDYAKLAVRGRSPVERDTSAAKEITFVPESEAPARMVQALYRLLTGLLAVGCARQEAWRIIRHVALSSIPAIRLRVFALLVEEGGWLSSSAVATAISHPVNTTRRVLEDLLVHGLIERRARDGKEAGQGRAYEWSAAGWASAIHSNLYPNSSYYGEGRFKGSKEEETPYPESRYKSEDSGRPDQAGDEERQTHCWRCKSPIASASDSVCDSCGWITCPACGACEEGCAADDTPIYCPVPDCLYIVSLQRPCPDHGKDGLL